ncbi:hypothetical protein ACLOJK_011570 [Asimina triloba]
MPPPILGLFVHFSHAKLAVLVGRGILPWAKRNNNKQSHDICLSISSFFRSSNFYDSNSDFVRAHALSWPTANEERTLSFLRGQFLGICMKSLCQNPNQLGLRKSSPTRRTTPQEKLKSTAKTTTSDRHNYREIQEHHLATRIHCYESSNELQSGPSVVLIGSNLENCHPIPFHLLL